VQGVLVSAVVPADHRLSTRATRDAGKSFQLSVKKQQELRQKAEKAQTKPQQPSVDFEELYNATAKMLDDLNRVCVVCLHLLCTPLVRCDSLGFQPQAFQL
jgi:hypothetical protein